MKQARLNRRDAESNNPSYRRGPRGFFHFLCWGCGAVLLCLAAPFSFVLGQAQHTATEDALVQLEKALQNETGLTYETKEALHALITALRAEREDSVADREKSPVQASVIGPAMNVGGQPFTANSPAQNPPPWEGVLHRLMPYGDSRLEWDSNVNFDDRPDRHRQRVRFRAGTNYQLTDELVVGARPFLFPESGLRRTCLGRGRPTGRNCRRI